MTNYPIEVEDGVWLNPSHVNQVCIFPHTDEDGEAVEGFDVVWFASVKKWRRMHEVSCATKTEAKRVVERYRNAVADAER